MLQLFRKIQITTAAAIALSVFAAGSFAPANAAALLYSDFSDLIGLQLNGSTSAIHSCAGGIRSTFSAVTDLHNEKVLRLTNTTSQAGSAFSTTAISLDQNASFSTSFAFHFTDQQNGGADGIVFVQQTVSNTAGGSGGVFELESEPGIGTTVSVHPPVDRIIREYNPVPHKLSA